MRRSSVLGAAFLALVALLPCHALAATAGGLLGLSLAEALERLRAEGANVVYSSELVRPEMRVVAEPAGDSPREILDSLLAPHGLRVSAGPNGALLVIRAERPVAAPGAVRGLVRATDTGLPFPGAEIHLVEAGVTTWSDRHGSFGFDGLLPGSYTVHASSPGCVELTAEHVMVDPGRSTELALDLSPQPRYLQELVVTPSQIGFLHRQPEASQFLDRGEVQQLPHLSDDLFRVVHWLPGTAAGDISSEFGVRGGAPDEVMFVLDGMQVHDPYHLRDFFSLFSIVDSEIVAGVDLLSGGYPVEFGDRMGGVVDLSVAVPERQGWSVGATGVHARAQAEGLWDGGRGTWLVSARRGYLDWLLNWLDRIDESSDVVASPSYWDLYASVRHPLGQRSLLSVHLLTSHDDVSAEDLEELETARGRGVSWYLWATAFSSLGRGLSAQTVVSATSLEREIEGFSEPGAVSRTRARDDRSFAIYGLDQDWVLEPWRSHLLKWGVDVRRVEATYDIDSTFLARDPLFTGSGPPQVVRRQARLQPRGWQFGLYSADRLRLAPGVTAEVGVRWDHQSWTPGDDQLSPRLNLVWETGSLGTVRASWGRFAQSQAIYELQVEDGVERFFPAQWAEHSVLSWERALPAGLVIRAEGYRKVMTDLRPRFENLFESTDLFPEGELDRVEVAPDRAEARGIELLLKGPPSRRWGWWVGYALSAVEDRIDGTWVPRSWDQRHALSFSVNWLPGRDWSVNLAGEQHSGWCATTGSARWVLRPDGSLGVVSEVGERNAVRLPAYSRVDLRVSRSVKRHDKTIRFFVEVMNLFDRDNIRTESDINFLREADGSLGISWEDEKWFPIFFSLGFTLTV